MANSFQSKAPVKNPSEDPNYQALAQSGKPDPSNTPAPTSIKEKPSESRDQDPEDLAGGMLTVLESTPDEAANISVELEQLGAVVLPLLMSALGLAREEMAMGFISNTLAHIGDPSGIKALVDNSSLNSDPTASLDTLSCLSGLTSPNSASQLAESVLDSDRYSDAVMSESDPFIIASCIKHIVRLADVDLTTQLMTMRTRNTLDGEESDVLTFI